MRAVDRQDINANVAGESAEPAPLAALYAEHGMRLRRFVYGILGNREAAEDVVQSTFAKAVQAAADVQPAALKSWLYRVAYHQAIDWRRRAQVERKAAQRLGAPADGGTGTMPDDPLVREETIDRVRRALQALSTRQQEVVRARMYEGKKFAEIAAQMRAPLATVITHMRRALEQLRGKLEEQDESDARRNS